MQRARPRRLRGGGDGHVPARRLRRERACHGLRRRSSPTPPQGKLRLDAEGRRRSSSGPRGRRPLRADHADVRRRASCRRSTRRRPAGVQTLQSASAQARLQTRPAARSSSPARLAGDDRDSRARRCRRLRRRRRSRRRRRRRSRSRRRRRVIQPTDLDHFKCYEALQSNFRQRTVGTRDQFGQRRARVLRTRQLCNPVSKNGGQDPAAARAPRLLRDARHRQPDAAADRARDEPVRPAQAAHARVRTGCACRR